MYTSNTPGKTGKPGPFGIPRKTLAIVLAVVVIAALVVFLTAFSPFVTVPAGHTRRCDYIRPRGRTTHWARASISKARSSRWCSWTRARNAPR